MAAKPMVSLYISANSPEPLLLDDVISISLMVYMVNVLKFRTLLSVLK